LNKPFLKLKKKLNWKKFANSKVNTIKDSNKLMKTGYRKSNAKSLASSRRTRLLTSPELSVNSKCRLCTNYNASRCLSISYKDVSTTP
jgi:hypothetical protein